MERLLFEKLEKEFYFDYFFVFIEIICFWKNNQPSCIYFQALVFMFFCGKNKSIFFVVVGIKERSNGLVSSWIKNENNKCFKKFLKKRLEKLLWLLASLPTLTQIIITLITLKIIVIIHFNFFKSFQKTNPTKQILLTK